MKKELWNKVRGELSNHLPDHTMSTWFEPIEPVVIDDEKMVLEVPNQFFYDWIESHYRQHINKALETLGAVNVSTKFIISAEKKEIKTDGGTDLTPRKKSPLIPILNKEHVFESFIEGSNNQFAKTAAEAVAENPGKQSFNPLIIYGGTGLGKTHLLHAIGNRVLETQPDKRIVIATSEKFTLDFVNGLRKNRTIEFAQQYRKADILLIDDIQFFRGKEQTQEQFFHTFNELYQAGKQIVLTADRYPGEMQGLQDRLLSRFQSDKNKENQKTDSKKTINIYNKSDLMTKSEILELQLKEPNSVIISAKEKIGIAKLKLKTEKLLKLKTESSDPLFLSSKRQQTALIKSVEHLRAALTKESLSELEVISHNLRLALNEFDWILGKTTTDDILESVFANFCVGK